MADLRFTWDPAKAKANAAKHGVSFAEAQTVFLDDRARLIDDPEHSHNEARFLLLGLSVRLRVLVVVHAYREATRPHSAHLGSQGDTTGAPTVRSR